MNRRTFLTAVGSAFVIASAGCTEDKSQEEIMAELDNITRLDGGFNEPSVTRFIDREAGVVLYDAWEGAGGGVTAIPISETDLE